LQDADAEMLEILKALRKIVTVGVVGGSDLVKQNEQLGGDGTNRLINPFNHSGDEVAFSLLLLA